MTDGIHRKYEVRRTDGSSEPGGKHEHCAYFVLDLEHDEHAIPAIQAYAFSCRDTNPDLSRDLMELVNAHVRQQDARCSCREAGCPHSLGQSWIMGPSDTAHEIMHKASKR